MNDKSTKSRSPAPMSSLMATKGSAAPSNDVLPRGEDNTKPEPHAEPAAAVAKVSTENADQSGLAEMLSSLNKPAEQIQQQAPKVTINVKLDQSVEQKLKQIVGFEKMKRSTNYSQQDWLEARISAMVAIEHAKLPKI